LKLPAATAVSMISCMAFFLLEGECVQRLLNGMRRRAFEPAPANELASP